MMGRFFFIFFMILLMTASCSNRKASTDSFVCDPHSYSTTTESVEPDTDAVNHEVSHNDPVNTHSSSYRSSHKEKELDNMRGFDPASEDDMEDNGMQRYFDANDDEAWD